MVLTGPELLNDKLFLAAEARVSGLTWEAAAKKQTMTAEELRKLAYDELPRWKELLRDAERILLRETGYEALLILRNLMRDEDPKIARDCTIAFFKINMTHMRHRMKSRLKNSQPDDFPSDEVLSYDELGTIHIALGEVLERSRPKSDDGDDSAGPNRPVDVPPVPVDGTGGARSDGLSSHGSSEQSEHASSCFGGAAEGSQNLSAPDPLPAEASAYRRSRVEVADHFDPKITTGCYSKTQGLDLGSTVKNETILGAGNERWRQIPNEGMYRSVPFKNESAVQKPKLRDCPRQDLNLGPPV